MPFTVIVRKIVSQFTHGRNAGQGVDGATETVEVVKSFRSHQLIEGSRVDCTVRITDHNVALRTARNEVGFYCNRIQ